VHQRVDRDDRAGGDGSFVQNGRAGADIHTAVERAAEQGGVRPDEDVVIEVDRSVGVTDRGARSTACSVMTHASPTMIRDPRRPAPRLTCPRADPDVTDQRGPTILVARPP